MPQLTVRDVEQAVKPRLRLRAQGHGRSLEEELRDILQKATTEDERSFGLGTKLASMMQGSRTNFDVEELHGTR
jgi:plasmid stability protein